MPSEFPIESSILDGDLRVGEFIVRPLLKTVRPADVADGSADRRLPDKAMDVLLYLAGRAREVCSRDELLDAVWGEDREAYDRVLDNAIREIRKALGDDARSPRYILTIPKRGYRLLARVEVRESREFPIFPPPDETPRADRPPKAGDETAPPTENAPPTETAPTIETAWSLRATLIGLSILVGLAAIFWLWPSASAVRVEVRASDPQSGTEAELVSRVRQSLFGAHPCGAQSLVKPSIGFLQADATLTASVERANGRTMLRLRHSGPSVPAALAQLDGGDLDDGADISRFLTDVSAMVDRLICFETGLPKERQACHCRAATTRTFHRMGQPAPHIELLGQAIELDPDDVDSYEALATIYRSLGDLDAARSILSASLARIGDPASVRALILRRRLAEMLGDYETEGGIIGQLRDLRPDEPRWKLAEAAHLARHRRDCARALPLIEGLGLDQIPPEATRLEASESVWTCLLHSDRQMAARRRLAHAPQDVGTRFQIALGSVLSGRLEEAHRLANEHLALEPESADSYWLLASLAGRQGAYSAARHWLEKMKERIEWPNQDLRYRTTMGWTDLRDGHAEECIERFADMPEGSRDWSVMARWTLGRCQVQHGDLEAARETLTELREEQAATQSLWQEEFLLHLEASLTAAESDEPETKLRAARQMIRATELGPADYPYFATEVGVMLEAAGDLDRARQYYEHAVAFSPSYPWGHCRLGLLHLHLGREADAVTHLRRALDVFGNPPEGPLGMECAEALAELDPRFEVAD